MPSAVEEKIYPEKYLVAVLYVNDTVANRIIPGNGRVLRKDVRDQAVLVKTILEVL